MLLTQWPDHVPEEVEDEISSEGNKYFHFPCSSGEIHSCTDTRFRKACLNYKE